jgi:hypothetical protein
MANSNQGHLSSNTQRAYAGDLRHFQKLGGRIPCDVMAIANYLMACGDRFSVATLARRLVAIRQAHVSRGIKRLPTDDPGIKALMRGTRRRLGVAQRQAKPVSLKVLRQLVRAIDNSLIGLRDRALLLLGFAGAFRRSELVALNVSDLERTEEGSDVDVLLMEGTTIGRSGSEGQFKTEQELDQCFVAHMGDTKGMVLVWTSGQNIDRLVTVFKACKKSGRQLILDMYTAEILRATGNPNVPQAEWDEVKVFLPDSQRRQIIKNRQFELAERYKPYRIYTSQLAAEAARSAMLFRPSMMRDLEKAECLEEANLVYSLWPGYLKREELRSFHAWLEKRGIALVHCHTSGHASPQDLQRFAKAIAAKMLVPIHSFETKRFKDLFENVVMKEDGQWWEVPHG